MTLTDTYNLAEKHRCLIYKYSLSRRKALSIEIDNERYIGLANDIKPDEEKLCLCHEIGHHAYAGLYTEKTPYETIDRIEHRANKWAYLKLIPIGELREALNDPFCRTVPEVADKFGVTEDFARDAITYYAECAGLL